SNEAYARIKPLLSQTASDDHRLTSGRSRGRFINKWWPYAAAAVAIIILTVGILQLTIFQPSPIHTPPQTVDFAPASHKAIITLSDGRNFELDTEQDKIYFTEDGIAYADGATLATTESSSYATISTPRGGTYQLILADGTSVTLNAASSLTYPTEFIGPTRHGKLEGEAFFDVSARPRPFLVETRSHTVEVLG